MHWNFTDNNRSVTVNLAEDSSNGAVWGTVEYRNQTFQVTGMWEAAFGGGIQARRVSTLQLGGAYRSGGNVPVFIALSGHIGGSAPNMNGIDMTLHVASSADGTLSQQTGQLTTAVDSTPPDRSDPPNIGSADTAWSLCNLGASIVMNFRVGGGGAVTGTLTVGKDFNVHGEWAAAGSVAGRNASAFEVLGTSEVSPGASDLLAAAGTMTGSGAWPQKVDISGSVASISNTNNDSFQGTLLPMWQTDSGALAAAYTESYMVIRLGGTHGDSQAVAGWIGPRDGSGKVSPFNSGNYQAAGTAMTAEQLADIVSADPHLPDTNDIKVPAFTSSAATRAVMIQFMGDQGHFPQPPLQEYHDQITKIFYDVAVGALVLQFADVASAAATNQINFNEGRKKNHNSVIIEPR